MNKNLTITSVLGLLAVILGAFGAHVLKKSLSVEELQSFETGVRYQMYHVIVLLFVNVYKGFSILQKRNISYVFLLEYYFFQDQFTLFNLQKFLQKVFGLSRH